MIFSPLDYALWLFDFQFASIAAVFVFSRHRSAWPLWIFLAWWTAGDVAQFAAHFSSLHVYALVWFGSTLPQFSLEFVLTAFLCGVLVKEHPKAAAWYSGCLGLAAGLFIAWRHHALTVNVPAILKTELACCGVMVLLLILGWIGQVEIFNREVGKPWRGIIAATIWLVAVQAVSFGLQAKFGLRYWEVIARIRPVGELVALGLFIRAGLQKAPQLFLVRDFVPNRSGEKFEASSVFRFEAKSTMVQ